jgi:hypothetical protein
MNNIKSISDAFVFKRLYSLDAATSPRYDSPIVHSHYTDDSGKTPSIKRRNGGIQHVASTVQYPDDDPDGRRAEHNEYNDHQQHGGR